MARGQGASAHLSHQAIRMTLGLTAHPLQAWTGQGRDGAGRDGAHLGDRVHLAELNRPVTDPAMPPSVFTQENDSTGPPRDWRCVHSRGARSTGCCSAAEAVDTAVP